MILVKANEIRRQVQRLMTQEEIRLIKDLTLRQRADLQTLIAGGRPPKIEGFFTTGLVLAIEATIKLIKKLPRSLKDDTSIHQLAFSIVHFW